MDAQRWKRLQQIFEGASGLDQAAQSEFLDQWCGDDRSLRRQVESLIIHDKAGGRGITEAVADAARAAAGASLAGQSIGPYRIERELGRGGMGKVYLAVRDDDAYRKQVAIKLVSGTHHLEILQRFRAERQILASLEHPHVARLIDGGETERGEPYVVMEYVDGRPIDVYCDERQLGTVSRLELFRKVCSAVQYAHGNLIIHRDIKPGNILVTNEGEPKLLDFGIAKLLDPTLFPQAARTQTQVRIMTPEYASPEQVRGETATTTSDVYSLGVLLYELLAGRLPYRLKTGKYGELEQAITDAEPERPSTAITREPTGKDTTEPGAIGRARGTDPRQLSRRLSGDLDNIVLMALRKTPARRYQSASELSEDIRRHLDGLPVIARSSTWRYRTGKFLRRHPVASAAAAAFLMTILGFTGLTVRQSRAVALERDRAVAAEAQAREEAASAHATADYLISLFDTANPRSVASPDTTARELLHTGLKNLQENEELSGKVKMDLLYTLGLALGGLGEHEAAVEGLEAAARESEALYGRRSLETAKILHRLGDFKRYLDQYDEAFSLLSEALDIRRQFMAGDHFEIADSYNNLAILAVEMGKLRESDELQTASVEMHRRLGKDAGPYGTPVNNLALLKHRQGKLEEALALATEARDLLVEAGDPHSTLLAETNIARIKRDLRHPEEALAIFESAGPRFLELTGPRNVRYLRNEREIATTHRRLGHFQKAASMYEALFPKVIEAMGTLSGDAARVRYHQGVLARDMGDRAGAERFLREALDLQLASAGERNYHTPRIYRMLAAVLLDAGVLDEAAGHLDRALSLMPAPEEYPHSETARILTEQARLLRMKGDLVTARGSLERARRVIMQTTGEASLEMGMTWFEEWRIDQAAGDIEAAGEAATTARGILQGWLPEKHPVVRALSAPGEGIQGR